METWSLSVAVEQGTVATGLHSEPCAGPSPLSPQHPAVTGTGTPPAGPFPRRGRALPGPPAHGTVGSGSSASLLPLSGLFFGHPNPSCFSLLLSPCHPKPHPCLAASCFPGTVTPTSFLTRCQGLIYLPAAIASPSDAITILNPPGASQRRSAESRPAISRDLGSLSKTKAQNQDKTRRTFTCDFARAEPELWRGGNGQVPSDRSCPGGRRCLQTSYLRDHQ